MLQIGKRKKAIPLLDEAESLAQSLNIQGTKDFALLMYYQAEIAYKAKRYNDAKPYIDMSLQKL